MSLWIVLFYLFADDQRQEVSLGGGASRHCFYDLSPSSQYQISVHTQMQEMEGPSVSITDMTRMLQMFLYWIYPYADVVMYSFVLNSNFYNNFFRKVTHSHFTRIASPLSLSFSICPTTPHSHLLPPSCLTSATFSSNVPPAFITVARSLSLSPLSLSLWEDRFYCCSSLASWWAEVTCTAPGTRRAQLTTRVIDRYGLRCTHISHTRTHTQITQLMLLILWFWVDGYELNSTRGSSL